LKNRITVINKLTEIIKWHDILETNYIFKGTVLQVLDFKGDIDLTS